MLYSAAAPKTRRMAATKDSNNLNTRVRMDVFILSSLLNACFICFSLSFLEWALEPAFHWPDCFPVQCQVVREFFPEERQEEPWLFP